MTDAMKERAERLDAEWKDEGGGYYSLRGRNDMGIISGDLAYIALPAGHPAIGKHYDDFEPDVNGGLTFAEDNVFGWDYLHGYNSGSPATDIPVALEYFRSIATTSTTTPEVTVDA